MTMAAWRWRKSDGWRAMAGVRRGDGRRAMAGERWRESGVAMAACRWQDEGTGGGEGTSGGGEGTGGKWPKAPISCPCSGLIARWNTNQGKGWCAGFYCEFFNACKWGGGIGSLRRCCFSTKCRPPPLSVRMRRLESGGARIFSIFIGIDAITLARTPHRDVCRRHVS